MNLIFFKFSYRLREMSDIMKKKTIKWVEPLEGDRENLKAMPVTPML